MSIEDRVARLEKSCRRWRWLASVSVLLLVAMVVMGQAAPAAKVTEFETLKVGTLEAQSIDTSMVRVVDESGKCRAMLSLIKDKPPSLALSDKAGETRVILAASEAVSGLCLFDKTGETRATLSLIKDKPVLTLHDKEGKVIHKVPR